MGTGIVLCKIAVFWVELLAAQAVLGQRTRRSQPAGADTLIAHTPSRASFLQAFGTLLCAAEAQLGSAVALPYISQLLEVKSLRGLLLCPC